MQFNPFAAAQKQVKNEGLSERERIEEDLAILQTLENDVSKLKGGIANRSQKSMVSGKKLYTLDWTSLEPGETVADTVQIIQNKMAELKNRLENLSVEETPASSAAVADVGISSQVNQDALSKIKQSKSAPKGDIDPSKIDSKIDSKNDRLASLTKDRPSFSGRSKPTRKPRKNAAGEKVVLQAEIASAPPAEVVEVAQPAPVDVAAPQNEPQRRPQENLGVKKIASPLDSILGAIEKGVMVALNGVPQNIKNSVRDKFAWLDKSVRDLFAADKRRPKGIVIVNDGFGRPMFEITRDKIDQSIRKVVLLGIMEHFGYKQPLAAGGYLFVDRLQEILKGMRYAADDGGTLKLAYWLDCEEGDPRAEEIMSKLIADYKIHLMPEGMMISEVITLFTAIQKNEKLRNAINEVKFEVTDCDDESVKNEQYPYPKMVIYPASGKDKAQFVLNEIFRIFGQRKGLDVTPRFNAKITSLIYYAQGNGDEKTEENENFFESDKVVYNATITGSSAGPRGYYLENPAARRRPPVQQGSKLQGGVPASTVEVPQTIPGAEAEPARKPRIGFSEVGEDQGLARSKKCLCISRQAKN
jgi:hypothetical protein